MNNKGMNTTLTMMLIGVVIFIGVMLLIYSHDWGIYNNFMADNQQIIDPVYANAYDNLTSQQNDVTAFSDSYSFSAKGILSNLGNLPQNIFATLVLGATAIMSLTAIPGYIVNILGVISDTLHVPDPIVWMITTIIGIFVAGLIIKAIRGNITEP